MSSQQHAGYGDQGQLDSSIDHFSCMKHYWGENIFVCMLAVECSVQNSVLETNQTSCNSPPPPPPTLHTSNGQRTKHRHQGTSAKAGFGMMVSRKCSGPEGIHRKTPQKDRPGSLTFSHGCVFLELQGIAKTPQRSLASHGGQKGRKPASNKLIILKTAIKTPINKKTC